MNLFDPLPENLSDLSNEEVLSFIGGSLARLAEIEANPASFVTDERSATELAAEVQAAVDDVVAARAELASREPEVAAVAEDDEAALAQIGQLAQSVRDEPEAVVVEAPEAVVETPAVEEEAVTASVEVTAVEPNQVRQVRRTAPARSRAAAPAVAEPEQFGTRVPVSLVAAAGGNGHEIGETLTSGLEVAEMMSGRRSGFGLIPEGVRGEKLPVARFDWREDYPEDRILAGDVRANEALIAAVTDPEKIAAEMAKRRAGTALVASGGLCAPVTPYYNLQMISVADRPVRGALPGFAADRGGIRYARPPALSVIDDGVGIKTAAEDAAGGSDATKTCQVVSCPSFLETDVNIIFHCLQFGNLGARTFPERVAHFNNLVLAAHARLAESKLLTNIDAFCTHATGDNLGMGATATIPSQVTTAAAAIRSRNRMADDAVLRVLFPIWVLDLLESDMYRTQFQRFDMPRARFIQLLRDSNVEPSFYKDSASGAAQIFGAQPVGGALMSFPATVNWFIFPEGSFLYLDGGILELGLVRDSVLNKTNDFQIFGETFENVAFVGVEALSVTSHVCDSGTVALPQELDCPILYGS